MNRPGLDRVGYRIGTYQTFVDAMVEQVATDPRLAAWTARRDDYGIATLQLWAYIGDILTFYQERIANEAFLRTAVHRESVTRLAQLIGYEPAPGIAAVVPLAFTVDDGMQVDIPVGLRVQSVPGQHERPQKFETVEAVTARSALNELRPVATRPARRGDTWAVFEGGAASVRPGDYLGFAGRELEEDPGSDRWDVRRVTDTAPGGQPRAKRLTWERPLGRAWPPAPTSGAPQAYRFRERAWPFGHDAPGTSPVVQWQVGLLKDLMSEALGGDTEEASDGDTGGESTDQKDPSTDEFPQEKGEGERDCIYLDRVYPTATPGGWVALVTQRPTSEAPPRAFYAELYRIREVAEVVRSEYGLTAGVTRLRVETVVQVRDGDEVRQPENIDFFPVQGTAILLGSEPIGPAVVPDDAPVEGTRLRLAGTHPNLEPGRLLLVCGAPVDPDGAEAETCQVAEVVMEESITQVRLASPLSGSYHRHTVRVLGNIASATHGESVVDEVVGDGDTTAAFQGLSLRKRPVTFVPRPGAPHGAAATLEVRADGIRYGGVSSLLFSSPSDRVFEHRVGPDGTSTVTFGDGEHGSAPPTGRGNITATYRVGLGAEGNIPAHSIRNLLDRPTGLKAAGNPLPSVGGTDAESPDDIRANAPNVVRTFGRVVSLRDFEDVARETTGIAKASASIGEERGVQVAMLTVAGEGGAAVEDDLRRRLVQELDARRDRNRRMVVRGYDPVHVTVGASVVVDPAHLAADLLRHCQDAMAEHFSFEQQDFGQAVHLSDVYARLQAVPGVVAVTVQWLDVVTSGGSPPLRRQDIPVAAHELAVLRAPGGVVVTAEGVAR